jgi:hypothetical protein
MTKTGLPVPGRVVSSKLPVFTSEITKYIYVEDITLDATIDESRNMNHDSKLCLDSELGELGIARLYMTYSLFFLFFLVEVVLRSALLFTASPAFIAFTAFGELPRYGGLFLYKSRGRGACDMVVFGVLA